MVPSLDDYLPSLQVSYSWYGASPLMILQKVLIPAEGAIMELKGIKKISSQAGTNSGTIQVEFSRDTKMNFAGVVLKERLNRLHNELPSQVSRPNISENLPDEFEKQEFMNIGVAGDYSISTLRRVVEKEIYPYLKSISGIQNIDLTGGVEPEIKIRTDLDRLRQYNVSVSEISARLQTYFFTMQSASLTRHGNEITLTLSETAQNLGEIENLVLRKSGPREIPLKEIADVSLGFQDQQYEQRNNGLPVIGLRLYKEPQVSMLNLSDRVKDRLQSLADKQKGRVRFYIETDQSKELKDQLYQLIRIALVILAIIFIILLLIVRDVKASLLIFSSVFFSVFTTFTMIYLFKIQLNLLTLSGLALGFGMFVDNAVVVFDSILRHREKGENKFESAVNGAKAVVLPVLASTITTIIVFFAFAILFKDRLRMFYLPLAYVIAISLLSSMAVAFILIPSLAARLNLKLKTTRLKYRIGRFFPFILKHPLVILVPVILIGLYSFHMFDKNVSKGQFFNWYSKERINVNLRFPAGTEFSDIKEQILKFEDLAMKKPYRKEIRTNIYPGAAFMQISFPKEIELSPYPLQLKQELVGLASNLSGVGVTVAGFDPEPYWYSPDTGGFLPYLIQMQGYNLDKLLEQANAFKQELLKNRRIKEVEISTDRRFYWGPSTKYFAFHMNRDKMRQVGITPQYLGYYLSAVLAERSGLQRLKFQDEELFVEVKSEDLDSLDLTDVLALSLSSSQGVPFRIADVVRVELTAQKGGISRENQEYIADVRWEYLGSNKAGEKFFNTVYNNLQLPAGFKKSKEKEFRMMSEEEEHQLNYAIFLAIGLIYLVLGILYENLFQPLIIMMAIPLALIGVWLAYWITDYNFDTSSYIGVILLSGIVVNNAIILIENINQHLDRCGDILEAIVAGTKERIRPIFMTTATTVLGMLPMVINKGDTNDIWSSLALCTIGGLTVSTILILFVLPIFFYLFYKLQLWLFRKRKGHGDDAQPMVPESEPAQS
jgi:HAE1 family hydrophobic/amphiphilic exporter-1